MSYIWRNQETNQLSVFQRTTYQIQFNNADLVFVHFIFRNAKILHMKVVACQIMTRSYRITFPSLNNHQLAGIFDWNIFHENIIKAMLIIIHFISFPMSWCIVLLYSCATVHPLLSMVTTRQQRLWLGGYSYRKFSHKPY